MSDKKTIKCGFTYCESNEAEYECEECKKIFCFGHRPSRTVCVECGNTSR